MQFDKHILIKIREEECDEQGSGSEAPKEEKDVLTEVDSDDECSEEV